MFVQLLVCTCIYGFVYFIKSKDSNFSNQVINGVTNVLSYDVNIVEFFNNFKNIKIFVPHVNENTRNGEEEIKDEITEQQAGEQTSEQVNEQLQEQTQEQVQEQTQEEVKDQTQEQAQVQVQDQANDQIQESAAKEQQESTLVQNEGKSQMELDAEYIKQNFNITIPVYGRITSGFGNREPTEIISAFHQGVDISAVEGTDICSAMNGTVIAASYAGDYGNHIKIQNGDVITVYAHCSKLNVNVGDEVIQNQVIGQVGATRKGYRLSFTF